MEVGGELGFYDGKGLTMRMDDFGRLFATLGPLKQSARQIGDRLPAFGLACLSNRGGLVVTLRAKVATGIEQ